MQKFRASEELVRNYLSREASQREEWAYVRLRAIPFKQKINRKIVAVSKKSL